MQRINHPTTNALNDEWANTCAARPLRLRGGPLTGAQVLAKIDATRGRERDALFLELLQLAQDGQAFATRVLLQAMLPKAIANARRASGLRAESYTDAVDIAIAAMYTSIATYRVDASRTSVAAVLGLKALSIINGKTSSVDTTSGYEESELESMVNAATATTDDPHDDPSPFHSIVKVLSWALDSHTLTPDEVRILANYELGDKSERAELVEQLGTTREALRKRSLRLRKTLAIALATAGFEL